MAAPISRSRSSLPVTAQGTSTHAYTTEDWGLLAAIALIWGSSFLFMDIGLQSFAPGVVTVARIGLGVATLALFARARTPVDREDWPRLALLGTVWTAIPLTLFPIALQWVDTSVAGMINGAMPIFAVAWSTYLLRKAPGWRQMLGIGVGFVGIVLVFVPELQASSDTAVGAILALVAVVFYGLATNLAVPLQQKYGGPPVVLRSQSVALLLVLPLGIWQLQDSTWSWESGLAMVPLGALGTGLAIVLMATLAGRVGATRASIAIYFLPLVAVVLGVAVLGESVAPLALVGVGLVLVGAWITSRREG
jgi:drug/metabolite transporter (DMT)-like permease